METLRESPTPPYTLRVAMTGRNDSTVNHSRHATGAECIAAYEKYMTENPNDFLAYAGKFTASGELVNLWQRTNIEKILANYIECALWSSTDDDGEPLDRNYQNDDIAPESLAKMRDKVIAFSAAIKPIIAGQDELLSDVYARHGVEEMIGHDFWLTGNGHGTGFWDRGLGKLGDELSAAAKAFGTSDLYVGDDGKIYVA